VVVVVATALPAVLPAASSTAADCLLPPEPVVIARAEGPVSFVLANGRIVRLADVRPAEDIEIVAQADPRGPALLRRAMALPEDRHGRTVGDLVMETTGESLSVRLLRRGLAFVDPAVMQDGCHRDLFSAEAEAEASRAGVWAEDGALLAADDVDPRRDAGRFAIVEGTVASIGTTRRTVYLNFGVDYRTDFTALARRRDVRRWEDELTRLDGERVRVRGVLEAWQGGLIRIEHPVQVERLGSSPRSP